MMHKLINNKVLVTGGSKGIGKAIAEKLALKGASISLLGRNGAELSTNVNTLPVVDETQRHNFIKFDLSDLARETHHTESYAALLKLIDETDILINCAGMTNHSLLPRLDKETLLNTIDLNLVSPIILTQLCIKPMLKASKNPSRTTKPSILNISSVLSMTDCHIPGTSVYAASKAGLLGFTRSLAFELKGKIRINSVLPGLVLETNMGNRAKYYKNLQPTPLNVLADACANIICNDELNGECIIVNGNATKLLQFDST